VINHRVIGGKSKRGIWFDPRTKIGLLVLCILAAATAPALAYELGLVLLVAFFGLFCGKWRYALIGALTYAVAFLLTLAAVGYAKGTARTTLMAFLGLVHKVYPCGFLSGIMISTTKVSEFLTAMNRMRVPKTLVIPLAVMLRYLPTIQEDWRFIKDAMRLRDVYPSFWGLLTRPGMTVECLYVPLMMTASKAADELSIASITRGIENPRPRTCLVQIGFGMADLLAGIGFLAYLCAGRFLFA
jgi:energy-coupling factor transport system permease protein